jgi:geranylgeranyl diphosphate synthase type II
MKLNDPTLAIQLKKDIKEKRENINMTIDRFLPRKDDYPREIHKAMRHTLFAGGKRLRPYLTILSYQLFKKRVTDDVIKAGAAIELLHTYTLIHDDLPEIDNDTFRRGKKTCHVVFGSNIALLAGDALLVEAFKLVNSLEINPALKVKMIHDMAVLSGDKGTIAGQMQDILSEGTEITRKTLEFIHLNKTSKLIQLCTRFGAYMAEVPASEVKKMDMYGRKLGMAFQITDDILDVEGNSVKLGKSVGKDENVQKATYPALFGMEKSKKLAEKYTNEAFEILDEYGARAGLLRELTSYLLNRNV